MAEFTRQFAICMPNGELYREPYDGYIRKALGLNPPDGAELPKVWNTREAAEDALQGLRKRAADMGVGDWLGVIVERLCTPFTVGDPAEQLVAELQAWRLESDA